MASQNAFLLAHTCKYHEVTMYIFYCQAFGLRRHRIEGVCKPGIARTDPEPAGTGRNRKKLK